MAELTLADLSHKKELTELWAEAFGDDEGFISSFLEAYMIPNHNVPAVISDGGLASALYLLDFALYSNADEIGHCAYLFAAATKKEHQNRGHMSRLIAHSAELCQSRGQKAIFLFPQDKDPKLFDFYSKFGFEGVYAAKKIKGAGRGGAAHEPASYALRDLDISDPGVFGRLYGAYSKFAAMQPLAPVKDRLFYSRCAASYLEATGNSGTAAHFAALERIDEHNCEKICYVFYKKDKNNYYIDDIIPIGAKNCPEILAGFFADSGGGINFEINAPPSSLSDAQNERLAMILPLAGEVRDIIRELEAPIYLNMFMNV